jgi:radical SAM superfamily enzyme YgiQ (UPF0313 family)
MNKCVPVKVWVADLTYTQQTIAADTMPAAVGGIATYLEKEIDLGEPVRIFKYPEKLAEALNDGEVPDIIGFSNYIWNFNLSYGFANVIKNKFPKTIVVFGGPNFPTDSLEQENLMRGHRAMDFYVIKEGEVAFTKLVQALIENDFNKEAVHGQLPSVFSIDSGDIFHPAETVERLTDITQVPSPYLAGKLDEFFDGKLLPIIQTNRGCPFTCTFCVEGVGYYGKVYHNAQEKISAEINYIGKSMESVARDGGRNDLFIADSNFGMYKSDLETCQQLAQSQSAYNWPEYINVATGKNKKARVLEASRIVKGAMRLSGSVQSLDETVLKEIKRNNISSDQLMSLALDAATVGANSYCEIILALPSDSKAAHMRTIRTVIDSGFTNIYLFQLMLLPGTDMCTPNSKERYGMILRYRVLPRCYGYFNLLGERVVAAEIEEICVGNDTLSFEDYLQCRRLHLIITIFYNDGLFQTLLVALRRWSISPFEWMEMIYDTEMRDGLGQVFKSFEQATKDELWEQRENLAEFIQESGNVKKFISGELGNNLLFVHKTQAIIEHAHELASLARRTALCLLEQHEKLDDTAREFFNECVDYHLLRQTKIFEGRNEEVIGRFAFDIHRFEEDPDPGEPESYRFQEPKDIRFILDDSQRDLVNRYVDIYGDDVVGIGRILSKVYVKKLFRHPIVEDESVTPESTIKMHIAGLQN